LPLISIIIPTLNEEENIAACLASTQNARDVERLVVDGGSKDRTLEIADPAGPLRPPSTWVPGLLRRLKPGFSS
jgi:glycosyltransferase involved in cell wall biosynthesis